MVDQLIALIQAYERDIKPQVNDEDERIQIAVCFQTLLEKCVKYNGAYYPDLILKIFEEDNKYAKNYDKS